MLDESGSMSAGIDYLKKFLSFIGLSDKTYTCFEAILKMFEDFCKDAQNTLDENDLISCISFSSSVKARMTSVPAREAHKE